MSQQTRQALVDQLVFRDDRQRTDLLDENITKTTLIALLEDVVDAAEKLGCFVLLTMVRTGHHDDGPHGHFGGLAADGWLLRSKHDGDYVSGPDPRFPKWISEGSASQYCRQVGLVGEADTAANENAEHGKGVPDSGPDHVHWGATLG